MLTRADVSPIALAQEKRDRVRARRDVCDFGEYVYPWWHAYEMHRAIGEALGDVVLYLQTNGEQGCGRLIILTPPQHGKSELTSRIFPAFAMGKLPDLRVFLISYGASLASGNSRAARNLVLSSEYQALFGRRSASAEPVELSSDSRSVTEWDLAQPHRGGVIASGIGGAVSGRAKGLVIVDDPLKGHDEAQSEDVRNGVWEFWVSTLRPRTVAGVIIMTRWNMDDLVGRSLLQMAKNPKADQWRVLMLPGLAFEADEYAKDEAEQREKMLEGVYLPLSDPLGRAAGEPLCPAMRSKEDLEKDKETDEFWFTALFQQLPYMRSGSFFERAWFKDIRENPPSPEDVVARVRLWDKAGSETGKGDYACGVLLMLTKFDQIGVEHVARKRCTPMHRDQLMVETARGDAKRAGPPARIWHQRDPASAGLDSAQATNMLFAKNGFRASFHNVGAEGSKILRAGPWSSALQAGRVFLVKGAWNEAFIEEHVKFPKGRFDDQVDAASDGFARLVSPAGQKQASSYQG